LFFAELLKKLFKNNLNDPKPLNGSVQKYALNKNTLWLYDTI